MFLRPHHLLCIQKFIGHGYDEEFTRHMKSVVAELADNPKSQITIVQGCDDLCKACPNNKCGVCTSLEKVNFMDCSVLNVCSITYGETAPWTDLANNARKKIFETDEFNRICACCQWFELCRNTRG